MKKTNYGIAIICLFFAFMLVTNGPASAAEKSNIFGLLLVGPYNDHGWSQAHFEAGKYVEKMVPGTKMIYIDKVNPADRPGVTIPQLVDDMVEKGARLIIANSDDMKDGTREAAAMHPDIYFIHISGDDVLTGKATKNLANLMGRMEYGKMMAGFAAALTTKTGKIGYLGPLINEETRRLVACAYLGAKHAWENVLKKDPKQLKFQVTWVGSAVTPDMMCSSPELIRRKLSSWPNRKSRKAKRSGPSRTIMSAPVKGHPKCVSVCLTLTGGRVTWTLSRPLSPINGSPNGSGWNRTGKTSIIRIPVRWDLPPARRFRPRLKKSSTVSLRTWDQERSTFSKDRSTIRTAAPSSKPDKRQPTSRYGIWNSCCRG